MLSSFCRRHWILKRQFNPPFTISHLLHLSLYQYLCLICPKRERITQTLCSLHLFLSLSILLPSLILLPPASSLPYLPLLSIYLPFSSSFLLLRLLPLRSQLALIPLPHTLRQHPPLSTSTFTLTSSRLPLRSSRLLVLHHLLTHIISRISSSVVSLSPSPPSLSIPPCFSHTQPCRLTQTHAYTHSC